MRVADSIAITLRSMGVSKAFGLQGGAVVHLFDAFEKNNLETAFCVSEYAAAFAANAYSRDSGIPSLCVVTTGPAGTNALTGALAAWQDSVPVVFVSGQTRASYMSYGQPVRQIGSQESPILDVVRPITKAAYLLSDPRKANSVITEAISIASSGRPGPVWIDVPVDVQWAPVDNAPSEMHTHLRVETQQSRDDPLTTAQILEQELAVASMPLLWIGAGVDRANSLDLLKLLVESKGLPFVTTWQMKNCFGPRHPLDMGTIGPFGQRGANAAVHTTDLLLVLGSHLSINQTTPNTSGFAPQAKKLLVTIDRKELDLLRVPIDGSFECDLSELLKIWTGLPAHERRVKNALNKSHVDGLNIPPALEAEIANPRTLNGVDPNAYLMSLFRAQTRTFDVVVDGGGTALYAGHQTEIQGPVRRVHCATAISAMGTALAECIGIDASSSADKLLVIIGDGSLWMSLADLPPLSRLSKPVVVVVLNNEGYLAIRHTQAQFLGERYIGTNIDSGPYSGNLDGICHALGFKYVHVENASIRESIEASKNHSAGVLVLEVSVPFSQRLLFEQIYEQAADGSFSGSPLSNMRCPIEEIRDASDS